MRAIGASLVAHGVIIAVLAGVGRGSARRAKPEVAQTPIAIVDVEAITPVEIVVIPGATSHGSDGAAAVAAPAPAPAHAHGRGHAIAASASSSTGTGDGVGPSIGDGSGGGDGGDGDHPKLDLTLSGDVLAAILNRPAPPPIPHNPTSEGGTHLTVDADGTAHVDPHGGAETHMILPHSRKAIGDLVDEWAKDPEALTRKEGSIANEVMNTNIVPIVGGSFGAPSDRNRQQRLLEQTFDQRADQRATHTADQLAHADQLVRANLARLWRRVTDPAERRQVLFELWDECEEGEGAAGEAGERARRQVIAWIRSHLPAGSTGAYSADEITALDGHRKSAQRFAPYE
jgi:hypothetical protein